VIMTIEVDRGTAGMLWAVLNRQAPRVPLARPRVITHHTATTLVIVEMNPVPPAGGQHALR